MYKIWLQAHANMRKSKSISATLVLMFIVAAFLLNSGLLVVINYGSFFDSLKEELSSSDAYFMLPDALYTDEVNTYIDTNEHIKRVQRQDVLWLGCEIYSKDKDRSYTVAFNNMDEKREISKWKFVGEHLPAEDMSVYVPDIFKAVNGYNLNDKIVLKYTDEETGAEKTLEFTVKGYTEDIFFSSTDTGIMGFYLPEKTYNSVKNILNNPIYQAHIVFTNLDDTANSSKIESGIREVLNLSSSSLIAGDASSMLISIDIDLIEMSRCMMANMIAVMMVIFALVIVIVCLMVVRFRIVNSIEDDIMKIGSMKSIGYTSKQIIMSILLQFLLIAGIGSIVGIALSYPALPYVSNVFEQQSGLKWEQGFDGANSFFTLAVLIAITSLVILIAARRINTVNPINALRGESNTVKYKKNYLPLENTTGKLTLLMGFKSVFQNIKQNIMIFIIMIGVSFAGAYGVIMYYNTSIDTKAFAEVPGFEITNVIAVLNPEKDHNEALKSIQNMDNVRKIQYLDEVKITVEGTEAAAYVMDTYAERETILVYEGRYPQNNDEIVLAGILAGRLNKKVGDTVTVSYGNNEAEYKVIGLSNGSSMGGINTSILTGGLKQINPDFKHQALYIYLEKGTDTVTFIEKLKNNIDKELLLGTTNFDKALEEGMAAYQNIVSAMGVIMFILTLFVVSLVLYFVISSSIIHKKRELGIQKAIGFTTLQLMNQFSISFMFPIIFGIGIGSLLGGFYTNPMMSVAMKGMGVMKAGFIVEPLWVATFGITTIVFSYALSMFITWRIRKISAYALVTE